jgi:hypothetical protein
MPWVDELWNDVDGSQTVVTGIIAVIQDKTAFLKYQSLKSLAGL